MHIYHAEGAGGGNAPDIMRCCMEPNCLPSSTNPTNPFSINTYDEEIDMLITCHNLNKSVPTDIHALTTGTIGRYALNFRWSDGHDSGIYTYARLRALCECALCRGAAAAG